LRPKVDGLRDVPVKHKAEFAAAGHRLDFGGDLFGERMVQLVDSA
jgi:hypothetical protein